MTTTNDFTPERGGNSDYRVRSEEMNDELGGKCGHSTLSDELASLKDNNAQLVKFYCAAATGYVHEACREDLSATERKDELYKADGAITTATNIFEKDGTPVLASFFEPLIVKVSDLALKVANPSAFEGLDKDDAHAQILLADWASLLAFEMVQNIYDPKEIPPQILGTLASIVKCVGGICGDALDLTPTASGGEPKAVNTALSREAASLVAYYYGRLRDICERRLKHS